MTINNKIKDEKLQYDINRGVAKISALSSGEIDKYEYETGEKILPPQQHRIYNRLSSLMLHLGRYSKSKEKPLKNRKKTRSGFAIFRSIHQLNIKFVKVLIVTHHQTCGEFFLIF